MRKNELAWLQKQGFDLNGKTAAITGATGGLGKEACRNILALGGRLVLVNRSKEKTAALTKELLAEFPGSEISFIQADLTDMASVKKAAEALLKEPLDVLVLNAGAYSIPRKTCTTGFDNVFQTNFVSHYYLVRQLLPLLLGRGAVVTAVGSIAHRYSKTDPADVDFAGRNGCALVYGNSKRYLMYALWGLQKQYPQLKLAIAHPGIAFTNITAHYPKLLFALIKHPMKIIFMHPRRAVRSLVAGMGKPQPPLFWIGPRWFDIWGNPCVKRLHSCSPVEARHIFATAETIYQGLCGQA